MNIITTSDLNMIVPELIQSELGILLVRADMASIYSTLGQPATWENLLYTHTDSSMTYRIFPLCYGTKPDNIGQIDLHTDLTNSRAIAIHILFKRWTTAGYNKHHAKQPFGCRAFESYMNTFTEADFMFLLTDK